MSRCPITVKWADLSWVELRCALTEGHDGPHTDTVFWFDDLGYRVPGGRDMERAA